MAFYAGQPFMFSVQFKSGTVVIKLFRFPAAKNMTAFAIVNPAFPELPKMHVFMTAGATLILPTELQNGFTFGCFPDMAIPARNLNMFPLEGKRCYIVIKRNIIP